MRHSSNARLLPIFTITAERPCRPGGNSLPPESAQHHVGLRFRSHRPDVTLMDLQMPDMNGADTLTATALSGNVRPMRILPVEDDNMIGQSLMQALTENGLAVDWVRDGVLAQDALAQGGYAAVLLDLGGLGWRVSRDLA